MEDILVPIAFFAIIPVTVWAVSRYRYRAHAKTIRLLETMSSQGEPITTEIVQTLGVRRRPKHADLRLGSILVAIALATLFTGIMIPEDDAQIVFTTIASFPFLVGLVYLGLWFMVSRKEEG